MSEKFDPEKLRYQISRKPTESGYRGENYDIWWANVGRYVLLHQEEILQQSADLQAARERLALVDHADECMCIPPDGKSPIDWYGCDCDQGTSLRGLDREFEEAQERIKQLETTLDQAERARDARRICAEAGPDD